MPIYVGYALPSVGLRLVFAGQDLMDYMRGFSTESGYSFTTISEREFTRDVKDCSPTSGLRYGEGILHTVPIYVGDALP